MEIEQTKKHKCATKAEVAHSTRRFRDRGRLESLCHEVREDYVRSADVSFIIVVYIIIEWLIICFVILVQPVCWKLRDLTQTHEKQKSS